MNKNLKVPAIIEELLCLAGYYRADTATNLPVVYFFKDPYCVVFERENLYIRTIIPGQGTKGEDAYRTVITLHDAADAPDDVIRVLFRITGVLTKEQSIANRCYSVPVRLVPKDDSLPPIETIFHHQVRLYGPKPIQP